MQLLIAQGILGLGKVMLAGCYGFAFRAFWNRCAYCSIGAICSVMPFSYKGVRGIFLAKGRGKETGVSSTGVIFPVTDPGTL